MGLFILAHRAGRLSILITWMIFRVRIDTSRLLVCAVILSLGWQCQQAGPESAPVPPDFKAAIFKTPPPTPIAIKKVELGEPSWNPAWDRLIEADLPPDLLSSRVARDVKPFCPRFKHMSEADKRAFWAYFFQALAGAEAGLRPTADVRHTEPQVAVVDTVTRRMVRAEGLLQLTYMDADRYGCNFDWAKDKHLPEKDPAKTILQPANNLTCGIRILEDQLVKRHEHLLSRKSYWETLRPGTAGFPNFIRQMANVPEACDRRERHLRPERERMTMARTTVSPPASATASQASAPVQ